MTPQLHHKVVSTLSAIDDLKAARARGDCLGLLIERVIVCGQQTRRQLEDEPKAKPRSDWGVRR